MKTRLTILLTVVCAVAAAFAISSCSGKAPKDGALIEGQVSGYDPSETIAVVLMHCSGDSAEGIMRDTLKNGRFAFRLDSLTGENKYLVSLFRSLTKNYEEVLNFGPEIYLEPGAVVRIKGEGRYLYNARITSPVKDQKLRDRFIRKMSEEDWKAQQDLAAHRYLAIDELYYGGEHTPEEADSLQRIIQQDYKSTQEVIGRLTRQELELLETEEIGAFALEKIRTQAKSYSLGKKENRETLLRLYERLSDDQKATSYGMETLNFLNPVKKVQSGSPIPQYDYVDKSGKTVHPSDFNGKWVLLDYWDRGCGACRLAIPELGAISKEFQDELAVVSINLDKEKDWKDASAEHGIFWNDWNDPKGVSGSVRAFGTAGLPTFVLISPDGIIQNIFAGYEEGYLHRIFQTALSAAPEQ